jgi:hypothetical protein
MKKFSTATIPQLPRADILALTKTLIGVATHRLASGKDVTQENIRIVNRARKAVANAETKSSSK